MSGENVEVVRSILANWARGDYSSVEWADPEIAFVDAFERVETRGVDALSRRWRDFLTAWDQFATVPERFIEAGEDRVLVLIRFEARGRASGTPTTSFSGGQLFKLRDGKVVRLVLYSNVKEALEAAGLSE